MNFSNTPGKLDNCDGVFTSNPKVVCSIKVADCMPIFFAHQYLSFYGVVHAGWKGLTQWYFEKHIGFVEEYEILSKLILIFSLVHQFKSVVSKYLTIL